MQMYVAYQGAKKFLQFLDSTLSTGISMWETNLYVALQSVAVLILPPIVFASFFKLGSRSLFVCPVSAENPLLLFFWPTHSLGEARFQTRSLVFTQLYLVSILVKWFSPALLFDEAGASSRLPANYGSRNCVSPSATT